MREVVIALKDKLNRQPTYTIDFRSKNFMQIRYFLSIPFIYGMIIPMILFHILIELYHRVTFSLYGIKFIDFKKHFIFNRHKLSNISTLQRLNCIYCEYGNGLASYVKEIIGKTETYWCPVKNGRDQNISHESYQYFMEDCEVSSFEELREKARKKIIH